MSDQSLGPGWWQASDSKWYPPETHPNYRPAPPTSARVPPTPGGQATPPPPGAPARQPVTLPVREGIEWASLAGAAGLIIGSFMAWATAGPFRVPGTDGDGWFTIVFGGAALFLSSRKNFKGAAICAAIGLAIVVWKFADLASLSDNEFITVSPGSGLYLCGLGGAVCTVTSAIRWRQLS